MSSLPQAIRPRLPYAASRREADPHYLAFIRQQPCLVSGCKARFVEAAHTGDRGLSQKASDRRAVPLCLFHHQTGNQSYHRLGRRKFESVHGLDLEVLVSEFNEWYGRENRR